MILTNLTYKLCARVIGCQSLSVKEPRPIIVWLLSSRLTLCQGPGMVKTVTTLETVNDLRSGWQPVIGLEVHAQIKSCSKLFSGAGTDFTAPINSQVSLFDAAIPGTLPVLNKNCVEAGVLTAIALSCKVNLVSLFDRKHYFYSDLPAGYQITQQFQPLARDGMLEFVVFNAAVHKQPYYKKVHIKQIQLEQDSGRSLHDEAAGRTLVDLSRAGVALMEIVFEPDLRDGEEAAALIKELCLILRGIGTCDCQMEEGSLRVDANVSVHRPEEPLGVRTEVKNLNSVRSVAKAIEFEINNQIRVLESGGKVVNETRSFNAEFQKTVPMRDKEVKQDYRYMPEPNLPPLRLCNDPHADGHVNGLLNIAPLYQRLPPKLPDQIRKDFVELYGVRLDSAITLVADEDLLAYYLAMMKVAGRDGRRVANLLLHDVLEVLHKENISIQDCPIQPALLGEVLDLHMNSIISKIITKNLLQLLLAGDTRTPRQIIEDNNWTMIQDRSEIERLCDDIIQQNPKLVEQYKAGKKKLFKALTNIVQRASKDKADMTLVARILKEKLNN